MQPRVIGWDLGGAHLKAALVDPAGVLVDVVQLPCPLWRGLDRLTTTVEQVVARWPSPARHAITMTGELVDLFPDRPAGVKALVECMSERFGRDAIRVYAADVGLIPAIDYAEQSMQIASANWLAAARYASARLAEGILLDVGSTTTDVVSFQTGEVNHGGVSDADRLRNGELVYTGVVRTPVFAVTNAVPFEGEWQSLTAELFSTMADVYRLLDLLPQDADQMDTRDGAGKDRAASARRLARMLGRDASTATSEQWRMVAAYLARRQSEQIRDAVDRMLSRNLVSRRTALLGAGVGRFVVKGLAASMEREYVDFSELCGAAPTLADAAANCAPAVAVALLGCELEEKIQSQEKI